MRLILILLTLKVLASRPFVREKSDMQLLYEVSFILALMPLIFPHQQHYAFFMQFPATTYLLYIFFMKRNASGAPWIEMTGLIFIFFSFNFYIIAEGLKDFMEHYKILTYAGLLVVILLLTNKPVKLDGEAVASV